jgi:hypothetical protein
MEIAQGYCALVENGVGVDTRAFLERCLQLLLHLFSLALELPDVQGHLGGSRVTYEEHRDVVQRIKASLGNRDSYWMVFEPFQTAQPESIYGSISDDLAGIWSDLKRGLLVARTGELADAICEWRFSFETHWGPFHAAHAFRPLFGLLFGENAISTDADAD